MKPSTKPNNPCFSSGPCAKRPGWNLDALKDAATGRSHRAKIGKEKLLAVIEKSREMLGIPKEYKVGIVPASDTGAIEMAMWSVLGERGVDVLGWESFGLGWVSDIEKQLKLDDVRSLKAEYGSIPNLNEIDSDRDIVFTWNGTTSGVKVPNADWIKSDRKGLTICDATSAVFAMDLPWDKLDITTWSWQKVMGGEAAHGMLVLSPRAVERLENYTPDRPLPKIFRLTKGGKLIDGIFKGETINTPSMLAVEDALDGLEWAASIGGKKALIERSENNLKAIEAWVEKTPWIDFLPESKEIRSNTSVCVKIVDPWFTGLDDTGQSEKLTGLTNLLSKENVAHDIKGHRDAPPHIRIWAGATIETSDVEALLPWLDWAFEQIKEESAAA